jgi:hypothetical protein
MRRPARRSTLPQPKSEIRAPVSQLATRNSQPAIRHPPIVNLKSKIENPSCLSMYIVVYDWTYAGLCRTLRRHLRLHLNLNLDFNLDLVLCPALNRTPFQKPFEKPNATLFRQLYGFKHRSLYGLVNLAPHRET